MTMRNLRRAAALLVILLPVLALPVAAAPAATSCVTCHANADLFDAKQRQIVESFRTDVHAEVGLSCQDCHGGNPDPKLAEDPGAMDPGFAKNPYHGAPARQDIPRLCGRCHSDPAFMKRFRPDIRVDQEREYASSHHGQLLAKGDTRVATCVDCHGVHGILRPSDPRSPVFPKHVAEHYIDKRTSLIKELLPLGGMVLDVGCGTGQLGAAIARLTLACRFASTPTVNGTVILPRVTCRANATAPPALTLL